MPKRSLDDHLAIWGHLAESVRRNLGDLEHLRPSLDTLDQTIGEALEMKQRQLALRAAAQQATRDLDAILGRANDAAVRLSQGVVSTYGTRSEKLREFGQRPRRGPGPRQKPAAAEEDATPPVPKPRRRRK
jgi:hypothetical protein